MKNLNKFTKHELINKIHNLDYENKSNQSTSMKIVESILNFKSFILKFTLITFIIKWIKKYSLIQKLWHFFRWIASAILAISMIDIYSLDIISWIKETSIYNWYSELFSSKEVNDIAKEKTLGIKSEFPKRIAIETSENETGINSISERIRKNNQKELEEINDNGIWNDYKHIIIISGVIISGVVIWYYSEEVKDGFLTSIEWIKNYFSRPPTDPGNNTTENIRTSSTQSSEQSIKNRWRKYFEIEPVTKDNISDITSIPKSSEIEVIDNSSVSSSFKIDKGKKVLTSPSLETLNNNAEEAWSESSSPKSDDSSSTITPEVINQAEILKANAWKMYLPTQTKSSIDFIENFFNDDKIEVNEESVGKLPEALANIIQTYDIELNIYKSATSWEEKNKFSMKQSLFNYNKWIRKYYALIFPDEILINLGDPNDEPTN